MLLVRIALAAIDTALELDTGLLLNDVRRFVRARLDRRNYPIGKKVSAKELRALKIERNDFYGDWNYVIKPRNEMP